MTARSPFARKPRTLKRDRNYEIALAVVAGGNLRGLGIMYGISAERVRQLYTRTLERVAGKYHEPVPTIREARQNATRWRALLAQFQHEEGKR